MRNSIQGVDTNLLYPAIRAVSRNADGMARMQLRNTFENQLTLEDVQALAPDILAAVITPCPADTMFGNEIRMGGFKALTKYHFKEGIEAGVIFAKTQGGHGSESRTGEIMKEIVSYGTAAREALPGLKELIVQFNDNARRGNFPPANSTTGESPPSRRPSRPSKPPTDQPELRTIAPVPPKGGSKE